MAAPPPFVIQYEVVLGAMLVDDAAKDLVAEGGVAEKAGAATAGGFFVALVHPNKMTLLWNPFDLGKLGFSLL